MAEKKRMGKMNLRSFALTPDAEKEVADGQPTLSQAPPSSGSKPKSNRRTKERTATLNIQVTRSQQRWLQDTAQIVRDNNPEPVPGPHRVYPVHLIQTAIDLLKAQDIDWEAIRGVEDLRNTLNL